MTIKKKEIIELHGMLYKCCHFTLAWNNDSLADIQFISDLHANDGVDEEEHSNEQADIRQSLEWLNKGPEEDADGVTLPKQFDQTSGTKQLQEAHVDRVNVLGTPRRKEEIIG